MSEIGRYRKAYPRLWRHPGFVAMTNKTARELTLYLLTGPQTNRIGLFHFSMATAAEDLGVGIETLRERMADVRTTFGWHFDPDARVFFIPSWWRWNRPENANVLRGNLKDLNEIPPCMLLNAFARNLETLPETLHQTFVECCTERIPKRSPIQDQDQGSGTKQKQEQEPRAPRGRPAKESDPILAIARQVRSEFSIQSREEFFDLVTYQANQTKLQFKKADVDQAINVVLSERNQHETYSR